MVLQQVSTLPYRKPMRKKLASFLLALPDKEKWSCPEPLYFGLCPNNIT
jgi:hypothetical protein